MSINDILSNFMSDDSYRLGEDNLELSLEQIKHRFDTKFTDELLAEFKAIRAEDKVNNARLKASRIPKLIEEYLGIELKVETLDYENAGVPYTDFSMTGTASLAPTSPFAFDENGKKILISKKSAVINVNAKTGYISGIKGIGHTIYMGKPFLAASSNYTAKESLSIFLHELGHIWTYYWTLPHVFLTNFLLGEFSDTFVNADSTETRTVLVREVEEKLGMNIAEKERLMAATKTDIAEVNTILLVSHTAKMKSLLGKNPYDIRNSEAMADQFVVRMGYGADLASAFSKWPDFQAASRGAVGRVIGITLGVLCTLYFIAPLTMLLVICHDNWLEEEYDSPVRRVEVILHGLRSRYKIAAGDDKKAVLAQIDAVEELLADKKELTNVIDSYYKYILPWGRSKSRAIDFQKMLENFANNSLTTRADRLRNIT